MSSTTRGVSVRSSRVFGGRALALGAALGAGAPGGGAGAEPCFQWTPLATSDGTPTTHFATLDEDGAGPLPPSLFAGGAFVAMDGVPARRIARWRSGQWTAVGTNVPGGGLPAALSAMTALDIDGDGPLPPAVFVGGGNITSADGVSVSGVAKWDGAAWSPVGALQATPAAVNVLFPYDPDGPDQPGPPLLVASGSFTSIGGTPALGTALWDGAAWTAMDAGAPASFSAFAVFDDDGPGPAQPALYGASASTPPLHRFSEGVWAQAAAQPPFTNGVVRLLVHDEDGHGPMPEMMYFGRSVPVGASGIAARSWHSPWFEIGPTNPLVTTVPQVLGVFDPDGAGPGRGVLIAGMPSVGPSFPGLLQLEGFNWIVPPGIPTTVSSPLSPRAIATFDDGSGLPGGTRGALFIGLGSKVNSSGHPLHDASMLRLRTEPAALEFGSASNIVVPPGGAAHLDAGTQAGAPVASYVWRKNGVGLVDGGRISGATTDDLIIDPVTEEDKGIYECAVTTGCSFGVFGPVLLDVPPVDMCPVDTNGDGVIDFLDLNGVLGLFGEDCP